MNIVIVGGGDIGVSIAKKLILEKHNITIIEEDEKLIKQLQNALDALIIHGNGIDINILKQANIKNTSLFIAVTNKDTVNIISCSIAKKLSNKDIMIVAKVENSHLYFDNNNISFQDFGIDMLIDLKELSIEKIKTLIEHPEAIEMVNYTGRQSQLVGIKINSNFQHIKKSFKQIGSEDDLFKQVRIVAINRNEDIIIPKGSDIILPKDKIYLIGRTDIIQKIMKIHFSPKTRLKNIIIVGGNSFGKELANILTSYGKKVSIIESDLKKCEDLSKKTNKIQIIHGTATDLSVLNELKIENSCFISITKDDEYNMVSAAFAKKYKALKTICMINNIELAPIIHNMPAINAVFSPHLLATAEILKFCRKGNIISITTFSEINAETIGLIASENIKILNKPLKKIKFPDGMIIGALIRGNDVIIPTGDNMIKLHDKLIIFILPSATKEVEKIFTKKFL